MKPQPAHEITPDYRIVPPQQAQGNTPVPHEVTRANDLAADQINAHKDNFIRVCLESLFTDEEIGEAMLQHLNDSNAYIPALISKLDPAQLQLTLRNDFSPTIILPSENHPEAKRQKGFARQTGHTLKMSYQDHWLGTMTIEYSLEGRIRIDITTPNDSPAE